MAIFGRKTARQRLRSAARQSLAAPAFSAPTDCTPWVLGGLWPAELETVTDQTTTLAEYLKADLQRIAQSANERLQEISRGELTGSARRAAEARAIDVARAFAVLRVESTVRQLRSEILQFPGYVSFAATPSPAPEPQQPAREPGKAQKAQKAQKVEKVEKAEKPEEAGTAEKPEEPGGRPDERLSTDRADSSRHRRPEPAMPGLPAVELVVTGPLPEPAGSVQPTGSTGSTGAAEHTEPVGSVEPAGSAEPAEPVEAVRPESESHRLQRLLEFVARQEPRLRWAIGSFDDGGTVLVTDLAHGWIPPGIELPADVRLLQPGHRSGSAAALVGNAKLSAAYAPGDRLGWVTEFGPTESSVRPRELPPIGDLGRVLAESTRRCDGLPSMVTALAKAGADGTAAEIAAAIGAAGTELDLLRVHLDTARYQLLAQYPDVDSALLLNCMLLAATTGIATRDTVSANYHLAWFQALSTTPGAVIGRPAMN